MNSYNRMIVHKVADYFGLLHEGMTGEEPYVRIYKESNIKLPFVRLIDFLEKEENNLENNKKTIQQINTTTNKQQIPTPSPVMTEYSIQPDPTIEQTPIEKPKAFKLKTKPKTPLSQEKNEEEKKESPKMEKENKPTIELKSIEDRQNEYRQAKLRIFEKEEYAHLEQMELQTIQEDLANTLNFNTPSDLENSSQLIDKNENQKSEPKKKLNINASPYKPSSEKTSPEKKFVQYNHYSSPPNKSNTPPLVSNQSQNNKQKNLKIPNSKISTTSPSHNNSINFTSNNNNSFYSNNNSSNLISSYGKQNFNLGESPSLPFPFPSLTSNNNFPPNNNFSSNSNFNFVPNNNNHNFNLFNSNPSSMSQNTENNFQLNSMYNYPNNSINPNDIFIPTQNKYNQFNFPQQPINNFQQNNNINLYLTSQNNNFLSNSNGNNISNKHQLPPHQFQKIQQNNKIKSNPSPNPLQPTRNRVISPNHIQSTGPLQIMDIPHILEAFNFYEMISGPFKNDSHLQIVKKLKEIVQNYFPQNFIARYFQNYGNISLLLVFDNFRKANSFLEEYHHRINSQSVPFNLRIWQIAVMQKKEENNLENKKENAK